MVAAKVKPRLLELGQTVATPAALATFPAPFIIKCLGRHVAGDWGDLDAEDRATNDRGLDTEGRILSSYNHPRGKLWIITEWDRSVTTCLLPSDY